MSRWPKWYALVILFVAVGVVAVFITAWFLSAWS